MARVAGSDKVYEGAELFRQRCLVDGRSWLSPDRSAWSIPNIDALLEAFVDRREEGDRNFLGKWRDQLASQPDDVACVAADVLAFCLLYPSPDTMGAAAKHRTVEEVVSWRPDAIVIPEADRRMLAAAFAQGVGGTGRSYQSDRPGQLQFFLLFARGVLKGKADPYRAVEAQRLADAVREEMGKRVQARHVLLHLLFPDEFERVSSSAQKQRIIRAFEADAGDAHDEDEALRNIRRAIASRLDRPELDFYDSDIEAQWQGSQGDELSQRTDVDRVRRVVERHYPDPVVREQCLRTMADAIEVAHAVSPGSWSTAFRDRQIYLNVGSPYVLMWHEGDSLTLTVDLNQLAPDDWQRLQSDLGVVVRGTGFASVPATTNAQALTIPATVLADALPLLLTTHHDVIRRLARKWRTRLGPYKGHFPSVVEYLREELGEDIPSPHYGGDHHGAGDEDGVEPGTRTTWMVQANPKIWSLSDALESVSPGTEDTWSVNRYLEEMHAGDRLLLWQSGAEAGLYAVGELTSEPVERPTAEFWPDQEQRDATEYAVSFRYTDILPVPLRRSDLLAHPILKDLLVIRAPQGRNFRVTPSQWTAIAELIDDSRASGRGVAEGGSEYRTGTDGKAATWWVNQGASYARARDGGYLWAPKLSKTGGTLAHWSDMTKLAVGDLVLNYANGALRAISRVRETVVDAANPSEIEDDTGQREGYLALMAYHEFDAPIALRDIPVDWREPGQGPFTQDGGIKQGYLFPLQSVFLRRLVDAFDRRWPAFVTEWCALGPIDPVPPVLEYVAPSFAELAEHVRAQGLRLDQRTLRRYHLALETCGFVILSGLSGTGKTWLAEAYARAAGARHLVVPVAPNWTTNEDLLGYANPLTGAYHDTAFSTFIRAAADTWRTAHARGHRAQPFHVVLDEMNLARVEYYFAKFLSAMEVKMRHGTAMVELGPDRQVTLTPNLSVIGTVNIDETTHGFADKVYDRAQLVELHASRDDLADHLAGKPYREALLAVWDGVGQVGPFAFRVLDEIDAYVSGAEALGVRWEEAFDEQLLQKVLPKLKGADPAVGEALTAFLSVTAEQFPLSRARAKTMLDGFVRHGFASYFPH